MNYVLIFYDTECWYLHPTHLLVLCFKIRDEYGKVILIPDIPHMDDVHYVYTVKDFTDMVQAYFLCFQTQVFFVAHNGGKWDHWYIYRHFVDILPMTTIRAKLVYVNEKLVHFRDSCMYFPGKLEDMGTIFGCHKQDFDYHNCNPWYDIEEITKYCVQDVVVLDTVWCEFEKQILPVVGLQDNKLIDFNSYAHYSYCTIAKEIKVPLYVFADWELYKQLKECYYGGRVISNGWAIYQAEDYTLYDIVSMYPSCLLFDYPYGNLEGPITDERLLGDSMYIASVYMEKDTSNCISSQQPLVPVKVNKRLLFYDGGKIYGMFTSVDVETFRLDGWKVTIIEAHRFTDKGSYLAPMYQKCFDERTAATSDVFKYVWKIIMNSSYGKFGQYKHSSEDATLERYHPVAWFCTSYSRRILFYTKQLFQTDVAYGDTDSVIVPSSFPVPEHLLQKHLSDINTGTVYYTKEASTDYLCVIAKKSYAMRGVAKCKGANKCTEGDIIKLLDGKSYLPTEKVKYHWTTKTCMFLSPIEKNYELKQIHIPTNAFYCTDCNLYHCKLATV